MVNKQYNHINTECIFELADNDTDFVKDIIGDVLAAVPESLDKINTAVNAKDEKNIIFFAHKLKGTFRFVGCNKPGDLMEQIERGGLSIEDIIELLQSVEDEYNYAKVEFEELLKSL